VRGAGQARVVSFGEALAPRSAAAGAGVDAVDQPGPAPGLDGDQRGYRDAFVAGPGRQR